MRRISYGDNITIRTSPAEDANLLKLADAARAAGVHYPNRSGIIRAALNMAVQEVETFIRHLPPA
ncbi:hypothetical protein GT370_05915 [Acidocella sp. MX-AZ03]|nr:hypothetical protein [Acidocella sp. MX-AZ03]WBO60341.1 hypothetical protein GT370_05915 [Acidocella sp. MX-AZ03]